MSYELLSYELAMTSHSRQWQSEQTESLRIREKENPNERGIKTRKKELKEELNE
jgi:hypothetical protein